MRFKSQAQAGLRGSQGRGRGKTTRVPHDRTAEQKQSMTRHDNTTRAAHDLTDPSALVQICAPVVSPLFPVLPFTSRTHDVRTQTYEVQSGFHYCCLLHPSRERHGCR